MKITCSLVHLFDKMNPLINSMKELGLFITRIVLTCSYFKNV